jgi:NAD(P)-dependent dehydrogenase (short-subunit alcohol dehydrogenase family)
MAYFDRTLQVMVTGTFLCARAAYPLMAARKKGSIVNVASIAALAALPRRNAYGAAKAGILSLTRTLACEWAPDGIRVNAVAPGYIATPMIQGLIDRGSIDPAKLTLRIPMSRLGTAEDVADAIHFLASDAARYVTGTTLSVDGGWLAFGASTDAHGEG